MLLVLSDQLPKIDELQREEFPVMVILKTSKCVYTQKYCLCSYWCTCHPFDDRKTVYDHISLLTVNIWSVNG